MSYMAGAPAQELLLLSEAGWLVGGWCGVRRWLIT